MLGYSNQSFQNYSKGVIFTTCNVQNWHKSETVNELGNGAFGCAVERGMAVIFEIVVDFGDAFFDTKLVIIIESTSIKFFLFVQEQ